LLVEPGEGRCEAMLRTFNPRVVGSRFIDPGRCRLLGVVGYATAVWLTCVAHRHRCKARAATGPTRASGRSAYRRANSSITGCGWPTWSGTRSRCASTHVTRTGRTHWRPRRCTRRTSADGPASRGTASVRCTDGCSRQRVTVRSGWPGRGRSWGTDRGQLRVPRRVAHDQRRTVAGRRDTAGHARRADRLDRR